jgi:glycosyltransferase involved in cell wall biosynthesis
MVIPTFAPIVGGAERQLEGIAPNLIDLGCKLDVVTRKLNCTPEFEDTRGYHVFRLRSNGIRFGFHIALAFFLLTRGYRYRVIHCHTLSGPALISVLFGMIWRRPVLLKVTRSGPGSQIKRWQSNDLRRFVFRLMLAFGARFVAISEDTLSELKKIGVPNSKISLIPNGVTVQSPRDPGATKITTIIYTGRLIQRKRVDLLLRAFSRVLETRPQAALLRIAGTGPELINLQRLSTELALNHAVKFLGELDHDGILEELRNAEVFALPSESEGMSNSLLEAMASGMAVIAADIPANYELIQPGINGLMFSSEDMLSERIAYLIDDVSARERMAAAAFKTVRDRFSFLNVAKSYSALYDSFQSGKVTEC